MKTTWDTRYSQRMDFMKESPIRKLLKFTEMEDVISFAGGLPAPKIFPCEQFDEACSRVLAEKSAIALQYGTTGGYTPLREWLAENNPIHANVSPDNIIITSGSQQSLDMLGRVFVNQGDHILVESPTYLGALQAWNAYGASYIPTRIDDDGLIPEEFENSARCGAKFAYIQPNYHNPTGVSLPLERRKRILEIADQYGIPMVEDDPYGQLHFDSEPIESLLKLDTYYRNCPGTYCGDVVYLGTFSKVLAPGMRIAYVIAPLNVINKINLAKQGADLHTATFNQVVVHEMIKDGFIDEHVQLIRRVYGQRRDVMLDALKKYMPEGTTWTHPKGGLFIWAYMPENVDTTELLPFAEEQKVAFVPGIQFFPGEHNLKNAMRLNFSNASPEHIVTGVQRLVAAYEAYIKSKQN